MFNTGVYNLSWLVLCQTLRLCKQWLPFGVNWWWGAWRKNNNERWNLGVIATFKGHSYSAALYMGSRVTENEKQLSSTFFRYDETVWTSLYWASVKVHALLTKGDITRDDSQRRFLAQRSVAMLELCCNYSKQCRNNIATLCCAKNRRCESSRVTSP